MDRRTFYWILYMCLICSSRYYRNYVRFLLNNGLKPFFIQLGHRHFPVISPGKLFLSRFVSRSCAASGLPSHGAIGFFREPVTRPRTLMAKPFFIITNVFLVELYMSCISAKAKNNFNRIYKKVTFCLRFDSVCPDSKGNIGIIYSRHNSCNRVFGRKNPFLSRARSSVG